MPSEKVLEQNKKIVDEIGAIFGNSGVYFVDFRGLNVPEMQNLRGKIKKIDSGFKVIKNRLIIKYVESQNKELGRDLLNGPTALAYSDDKVVEVAKILSDFEKDSEKIKIKFGFIDDKFLDESEIKSMAKLPGKDQLMSQIALSIVYPLKKMGMALSSPLKNMLILMQNLKDKKEKEEVNNG